MNNEGVKEIADLARAAAVVDIIEITEPTIRAEPIKLAAVPNGNGNVDLVSIKDKLDFWRTAPERIKGTAKALTIDAFVGLVDRHKSDESAVFGDLNIKAPTLTAVIDYHSLDHSPAWTVHRISYAFPLSQEWKIWQAADGTKMQQSEFGAFIEDHIAELTSPLDQEASTYEPLFRSKFATPSDLMTLSRGLEVCVEGKVKEIRILQSGEAEVSYEEVHKDGSGAKLVVPGLFVVSIPLFIGGEKERIIVRLRYRKVESRIVWIFQMYRADLLMREALERSLASVAERTGLPVFEAMPEA